MNSIRVFLIGIILGIANVIPGVSGGTMAVVFNIYDRLVALVSLDFKRIRQELPFLAVLVAGMGVGIVLFARLVTLLFDKYPVPTAWFFMGIIIGSISFIARRTRGSGSSAIKITLAVFALAGMAAMVFFRPEQSTGQLLTILTPSVFIFLFFAGCIGAVAMIIPGLSGSFVFLLIGAYRTIIQSVSDFNIPIMIPIALGVVVGLLTGAALIRSLLTRWPDTVYSVILGLVVGSLVPVFPGIPLTASGILFSVVALVFGVTVSWLFSRTEHVTTP